MKTCKICGKAMDDSYNACPYCGFMTNPQNAEEQTQQNTHQNANQQSTYQQNTYSEQNNFYQQNQNPFQQNNFNQPYNQNSNYTHCSRPQRSAYIAAILAIIGGAFGLHNFYLDNNKIAKIQLIISIVGLILTFGVATVIVEIWSVIEGIKILKGEINTDGTGAMIKMSW